MADWRFYGREPELERLGQLLQLETEPGRRRFNACRIMGRRGVGKSVIIGEVARRSNPDIPFVLCEVPNPDLDGTPATALERLIRAADKAGCGAALAELPEPHPLLKNDLKMRFADVAGHLIDRGAVVALDEFQHADPLGLVSPIKLLIDHSTGLRGGQKPRGKLVLTGSHQQRIIRMFRDDMPLYQRVYHSVRLRQWPVRTVLEMAAEHGLLSRPGRLLTLWTAYGGIPRNWERFVTASDGARLRGLHSPDDGAWRRAFLQDELKILDEPSELFDGRAYVELAPDLRKVVLRLGRGPARGMRIADLAAEFRPGGARDLGDDLLTLRQHLEMVMAVGEFFGRRESGIRWRIDDASSLFQLRVFQELFKGDDGAEGGEPPGPDLSLARLETLEGETLERFAAIWLRERPGTAWSLHGVWRAGLADIDVIAETGEGDGARLVLGGCKRDPEDHRPGRLRQRFDAFIDSLASVGGDYRERAERLRSLPQRHMAFSPAFTGSQRERLAEAGFGCFGIRDMARECGIDPGPSAEAEASQPEPSPGFGP